MSFIRQPEYIREIMGLYISTGNSRKYLAVVEKHVRDNSSYVSFYDKINNEKISSLQPKCTLNFTEIMYGVSKNKDQNVDASKANDDIPEAPKREIISLNFSKDGKLVVVLMSDQYLDTKVCVYDWSSTK